MLEQKFNFPVKDLILIYHLKPKNVCVAIKLWMVCVFEVVTILAIFVNFNYHGIYQQDDWANCASPRQKMMFKIPAASFYLL